MAIFRPTFSIPSSFTQGTIDVNDNMEVQWQVNGNSAMIAFQIDFYLNDYLSTPVKSTGRLTDGCPFYGLDRFGKVQFFTWSNTLTWAQFTRTSAIKFFNGNEYKYRIIQWYKSNETVVSATPTTNLDANATYYFGLPDGGYAKYISSKSYAANSTKFYYNVGKRKAWCVANNTFDLLPMAYVTTLPSETSVVATMAADSAASAEDFVYQTSFSAFATRSQPTLFLLQTDKNYQNAIPLPSILTTSIGYFHADYEQEQGVPIRWVRWQIAIVNNGTVGEILADTGDIYTPTLNYEYNGFFNGQQYAIRCLGESEGGQTTLNSSANVDGWQFFTINIENQGQYTGNITVKCLNKENATLVAWDNIDKVEGVAEGEYVLNEDSVELSNGAQVTWNNLLGAPMNFNAPWVVAWRGKLTGTDLVSTITFSGNATTPLNNLLRRDFEGRSTTGTIAGTGGRYSSEEILIPIPPSFGIRNSISAITVVNESGSGDVSSLYTLKDNNTISLTLYSVEPSTTIGYSFYVTFYPTYYLEQTFEIPAPINSYEVLGEVSNYEISYTDRDITAVLYSQTATQVSLPINVSYNTETSYPQGKLFSVNMGNRAIEAIRENENIIIQIKEGDNVVSTQSARVTPTSLVATIFIDEVKALIFCHSMLTIPPFEYNHTTTQLTLQYTQEPISSISIYGASPNSIVYSFSVFNSNRADSTTGETNISEYYDDVNFKPDSSSSDYSLYMTANMQGTIDGVAGSAIGTGFRIYRQEVGKNTLFPVATLPNNISQFKDYGIVSRKVYQYSVYAYDGRGAFMTSATSQAIATGFQNYSLLVCDYDETNDEYHVRKQYLFALNLVAGSVGNNNTPTLNANFTKYPTRMPSTQNYASGTLQGLIGAIYTVPALIEQIGNYKWTTKPSTMDYFDNVDLEKELYDLSTAPYQLFLRDMKGRIRMIATNSAISMTTNIKQKQQSISISFPWVEIGDASDVTIIQTPDDYGWNNDNQSLDVQLDVDAASGELWAKYPFPYSGTRFYLTGVNKETLAAKTPLGVTPAQFELSETATQPADGKITATIQVKR